MSIAEKAKIVMGSISGIVGAIAILSAWEGGGSRRNPSDIEGGEKCGTIDKVLSLLKCCEEE